MSEQKILIVRRRADDYNYILYLQVASLLASATTLALGAIVLVQIVENADDVLLRCVLWLATVLAVFSIFGRAVHDNMFQTARVRSGVWYYMLMGLSQIVMFATLQPQHDLPNNWRWWFPAAVAYIAATALLIRHIKRNVALSDFPAELADFAETFVKRTKVHDVRLVASNMCIMVVATIVVFLAPDDAPFMKLAVTGFGIVLCGLSAALLYQDFELFEKGWNALERAEQK